MFSVNMNNKICNSKLNYLQNKQAKTNVSFKNYNKFEPLYVKGDKTTAKIFAKEINEKAIEQIRNLCNMPIFNKANIRIMPDVSATKNCVVGFTAKLTQEKIDELPPSILGNDIGCGVLLVKTNSKIEDINLSKLDDFIKSNLFVNKKLRPEMPVSLQKDVEDACELYKKDSKKVFNQVGTLGNGNHFIELDVDENQNVYLAIHTGSRQLGRFIKDYYEKLYSEGNTSSEMSYAQAILMAQRYAKHNRESLAKMILNRLKLQAIDQFDCPHNYIAENGIVHKGSINASLGQQVLIPLNMRDGMVIGIGKGNADWNYSAPHGSGRKVSRMEAQEQIKLEDYKKSMKGIYSSSISEKSLDEAPQAYKDSDSILNLIKDTVDIKTVIRPIYNFKQV